MFWLSDLTSMPLDTFKIMFERMLVLALLCPGLPCPTLLTRQRFVDGGLSSGFLRLSWISLVAERYECRNLEFRVVAGPMEEASLGYPEFSFAVLTPQMIQYVRSLW